MNTPIFAQPYFDSRPLIQAYIDAMRKDGKKARNDPAYARQQLIATGMYTKTGKIKKQFR